MSYHIYLNCADPCPHCYIDPMGFTSNAAAMWLEAAIDGYPRMTDLSGLTSEAAKAVIFEVIHKMRMDPERFRAYEPSNGWGKYDDFLPFLVRLHMRLDENPHGTIDITT